ncbi:MAG: ABC transporter ATP-binding protein [Rhizobiaceae bacterium]|nr:ABC transporter ATP-binding protein [Rhizobiaceae bacterium]
MTLLVADALHVSLGARRVVDGISFAVKPGEFVALVGPNGAGKSTLLRTLAGVLPYSGSIRIDGEESAALPAIRRARTLAFLPQERDVAWNISVEALVALGRSPHITALSSLRPDDERAVDAAMRRMEVLAFRKRPVAELSGGEKALVLVARALAQETPLLLADEPSAGLDPAHGLSLMATFAGIAREGKSVIASTHDLGMAAAHCTRILLLAGGRIVADGAPGDVLTVERIREVYGVESYIATVDGRMIVQPLDLAPAI